MLYSAPSVGRFAHCKIVSAYCSLLRRYATNSTLTNHCVIKMLHRVAWDCKMPAMLFQLSLFKTFQMIMNDPRAKIDPTVKVRKLMNRCRTFLLVQAIICLTLPGRNWLLGAFQVCRVHLEEVCRDVANKPQSLCGAAVLEDGPRGGRNRSRLRQSPRVRTCVNLLSRFRLDHSSFLIHYLFNCR